MPISKPFRRAVRPFVKGGYGREPYVRDPRYATSPEHYVRAFLLLQKDLFELFEFVEPSDKNANTYSHRIHSLLMRTCMEVESNCKAILADNGYSRDGDWNMKDYRKIEPTHLMSSYAVKYPIWGGGTKIYVPFAAWATGGALSWYQDYNKAKHDRHTSFEYASFANLTEAVAALLALLTAQFGDYDFLGQPTRFYDANDAPKDGFMFALGDYLFVKYPEWPVSERYDFDWFALEKQADPFQLLQF